MINLDDIFIKLGNRIEEVVPDLAGKVFSHVIPEGMENPCLRFSQIGDDSPISSFASTLSEVTVQISIFSSDLSEARGMVRAIASDLHNVPLTLDDDIHIGCRKARFHTPAPTKTSPAGWDYHAAADIVLRVQS